MPTYLPNGPLTEGAEPVAIYARISLDDTEQAEGVARQIKYSLEYCAKHDLGVYAIYCDNDLSASIVDNRPDYAALRADIQAGKIRRVIIRHQSRLWRHRVERATDITDWGKLGIKIDATRGPSVDLGTSQGRYLAGILGETDTSESEIKSERLIDLIESNAQQGIPHGRVPYGWRREYEYNAKGQRIARRDVPYEPEARIIRYIHDGLLSGRALTAIADDLNAMGVPTPGADEPKTGPNPRWNSTTVRTIARRPSNAGFVGYHMGRPDQQLYPAQSPPLVDPSEWKDLNKILDSRLRGPKPGKRLHLLTYGVGECGVCASELQVTAYRVRPGSDLKILKYVCTRSDLARIVEPIDELVHKVMIARLSRRDAEQLFVHDGGARVEDVTPVIAEKEAKLLSLTEMYAQDLITRQQVETSTRKLREEIRLLEESVSMVEPEMPRKFVSSITGDQAQAGWEALDTQQQRHVMQALGLRVIIRPVGRGRRRFDPRAIKFVWDR